MDPMEFSAYIYTFPDAAVENLCSIFEKDIPDIEYDNAGDKLAELFITIITEVAGAEKKKAPRRTLVHLANILILLLRLPQRMQADCFL